MLVKWKRFIGHLAGSGGSKKHHLVKPISTIVVVVGWFEETKNGNQKVFTWWNLLAPSSLGGLRRPKPTWWCTSLGLSNEGGSYLPFRYMVLKTSFGIEDLWIHLWMSMNHWLQGMTAVKNELNPRKGLMLVNESVRRVGTNWCEQATRPLGGGNCKQEPKLVQLLLHEVQLFDQIWSRCQNWFWDGQHCGEKSS